jgi:hypothetical protein
VRTLSSLGTLCQLISFLLITFPGSAILVPSLTTGFLQARLTRAWPAIDFWTAQGADSHTETWQQPTQAQDLRADSCATTADGLMLVPFDGDLLQPSGGSRMERPSEGQI